MNKKYPSTDFSFTKPAVYQIKIQGDLGETWADKLSGMQITVERKSKKPVSTLTGIVRDQSALAGMLNVVYELHMSVISVKVLDDTNN
jgi:hypothetical protein